MRAINKIIIHCSATPEGRPHTVEDIRRWHVDGNGWADIGYHFVVYLDGSVHEGRPLKKIGAHASGQNKGSIGICYIGGMTADMKAPKDTRTAAQKRALRHLVGGLREQFGSQLTVHGHNEFSTKACPSFDVQAEEWPTRSPPVIVQTGPAPPERPPVAAPDAKAPEQKPETPGKRPSLLASLLAWLWRAIGGRA